MVRVSAVKRTRERGSLYVQAIKAPLHLFDACKLCSTFSVYSSSSSRGIVCDLHKTNSHFDKLRADRSMNIPQCGFCSYIVYSSLYIPFHFLFCYTYRLLCVCVCGANSSVREKMRHFSRKYTRIFKREWIVFVVLAYFFYHFHFIFS